MKNQQGDILIRLKSNPNEVMVELYRDNRKEFLSWAFKSFGAEEADALDCFQDAMIAFYRNVVDGKITVLTSSVKTYIFSIGKNMLLRKFKSAKKEVHLTNENSIEPSIDDLSIMELYSGSSIENRVADIVKTLRDPCRSILRYFYFRGFSMAEIATEMQYKNAQTVKAQKVRCIKEVQNLVHRKMRTEL